MALASQQHQAELHKKLWDMANSLRGQMEASEFKNYILGVIFYRFLSEKVEAKVAELLKNTPELTYEKMWEEHEEHRKSITNEFVDSLGYIIEPKHLFSTFIKDINAEKFSITIFTEALNYLSTSTLGSETQDSFIHLFDDLDLNSSKLGKSTSERTALISKIIQHVAEIPFSHDDIEIDVLGDAYEYMISKFAATAGKSAGEFYTPQQVSRILAKIVAQGKKQLRSVYDPTCGSGSLLLRVARETKVHNYYGQELTSATFNLARMNMMLHGVSHHAFDIKNDNTLTKPQHLSYKFEAIVANPPYSAHWNPDEAMSADERFSDYGKLAPKTKADYAFVQHMIHHLDDNGTMAVVLPHGVLFRGSAEGAIRKHLIEKNYLDAVIGLPANIFYGTSIPTCILVFKKCREADDKVLFIDASNEFEKGKNSNSLRDEDVDKIVEAYASRTQEDKFSREVELKEIKENDYNLNIPRYVDVSEAEDKIDLYSIRESLVELAEKEDSVSTQIENLRTSLMELTPISKYAKKIYEEILESSPTLQSIAMIYDRQGINIRLYDGEHVESDLFSYYPTHAEKLKGYLKEVLRYLPIDSYVILIEKQGTGTIFYGVNVREAVWTNIENFRIGVDEESQYDIKWDMVSEGIKESISQSKIAW